MQVLIPGRDRPYVDGDSLDQSVALAFTVPAVLSPDECAGTIARVEQVGFAEAPVTTNRGFVMMPDIRNNTRVMFDDVGLAADLFSRIEHVVPREVCGMHAVGVNERFRCYRYEPGQRFARHYDGAYARNPREVSQLTFMIYLNEGFTGGGTLFHHFEVTAIPVTGMALFFQHHMLHEGSVVDSGRKYVLRSDVMYAA